MRPKIKTFTCNNLLYHRKSRNQPPLSLDVVAVVFLFLLLNYFQLSTLKTNWSINSVSVAQSVSAFGCYNIVVTERLVVQAHPGTKVLYLVLFPVKNNCYAMLFTCKFSPSKNISQEKKIGF